MFEAEYINESGNIINLVSDKDLLINALIDPSFIGSSETDIKAIGLRIGEANIKYIF